MPTKPIDRDEYEATIAELTNRRERREGEVVIITGHHEGYGRTLLRRLDEVCILEADDQGHTQASEMAG